MLALGWARRHAAAMLDVALVVALAGAAQYEVWVAPLFDDGIPGPRLPVALLLALATVPLAWRRWAPVAVLVCVLGAVALVSEVADETRSGQPPVELWLAVLVVFYSVGAHAGRRRAVIAGVLAGAALVVSDITQMLSGGQPPDDAVGSWFLIAAAWGLGFVLRGRDAEASRLAARADRLEREREEQSRRAVARERALVARELHDVVAHGISVIVIQAQATQRVLDGEQASAREGLTAIETTARQALTEMRRLVGLLREHDGGLALAPRPSLDQADALVEQVRRAGLPAHLRIEGERRPLAPGVDLAAYRILQEALTNALKHAGPAHAEVVLRYCDEALELEVTDDGRGAGADRDDGHGLVGMRERATLYGGVLETGARDGGGFTVRVRLPG